MSTVDVIAEVRRRWVGLAARCRPHPHRWTSWPEACAKRCESPIEELFLWSLLATGALEIFDPQGRTEGHPIGRFQFNTATFLVHQQSPVGGYRLDFALCTVNGSRCVAVELDGHDFHERTKQQAARDRKRDRWFTASGWVVLRFTGSEIYELPHRCVRDLVCVLEGEPIRRRA